MRRAIAEGVEAVADAPEPLAALFAELDTPPGWMDADRCDRAARHLVRQGREYGLVLGAASLLAGAQNSVAGKPLTFTGRYATQRGGALDRGGVMADGGHHSGRPG